MDQRLLLAGLALSKLAFPVLAFFWLWVARQWHEEQGPSDGVGVDVVLCSWVLTIVLALPGLASQGVNPSSSADFGGWYHRNLAGLLSALLHWVTLWLIVVAASRKVSLRRAWEEALVLPLTTLILPLVASRLVMGTVRIALNAPPPLLRLYTNLQADSPFLMLLRAGSPLLNGVLFTPLFMLWVPALLLTAYQRYRAGIDGATEATAENP